MTCLGVMLALPPTHLLYLVTYPRTGATGLTPTLTLTLTLTLALTLTLILTLTLTLTVTLPRRRWT